MPDTADAEMVSPALFNELLREAKEIIQWLRDIQNGCPLEKYRMDFDRVNAQADAFLARLTEPEPPKLTPGQEIVTSTAFAPCIETESGENLANRIDAAIAAAREELRREIREAVEALRIYLHEDQRQKLLDAIDRVAGSLAAAGKTGAGVRAARKGGAR